MFCLRNDPSSRIISKGNVFLETVFEGDDLPVSAPILVWNGKPMSRHCSRLGRCGRWRHRRRHGSSRYRGGRHRRRRNGRRRGRGKGIGVGRSLARLLLSAGAQKKKNGHQQGKQAIILFHRITSFRSKVDDSVPVYIIYRKEMEGQQQSNYNRIQIHYSLQKQNKIKKRGKSLVKMQNMD